MTYDPRPNRTANIRRLVEINGGPAEWARKFSDASQEGRTWSASQVSQWISESNPKPIGEQLARRLELAQGLPTGTLDRVEDPDTLPPTVIPVSSPETASSYVRVEQLGEASMGDGSINDDFPDVIRSVDFTEPYIRSLVGFMPPPGRLKLVTGRGDSMIPTIMPGDVVLVDTGCAAFDGDGLYLVNSGNGQQIKRLHDRGGVIHVVSDNAVYAPVPVNERTVIGGKVYLRNRLDRMA